METMLKKCMREREREEKELESERATKSLEKYSLSLNNL